ncbi:MAG: acyltransferase family protein [Clostridia bacterium]|nr:acyltransferase family protein [Clostridia bacterium]
MNELKSKERDNQFDILRVMAMFMVIVIHVANCYCRAYPDISDFSFFWAIVFNGISRISVPIFFMISGALLLSSKYSNKKNLKRVVSKTISLIIVTIVYLLWEKFFLNVNYLNLLDLLFKPARGHLWFMYALIGLYIALPFIKCMVDNMTLKEDILFLVLWLILIGGVSFLNIFINSKIAYPIPIINGCYYLGYFVLGHIIYKHREKFNFKKYNVFYIIAFILCFVVVISLTLFSSMKENKYVGSFYIYRSVFYILASSACFILIYFNCKNRESKNLKKIAANSFSIYLMHGIALDIVMKYIPYRNINSLVGIPVFSFIVFIITQLGVYLASKLIAKFRKKES